MAETPEERQARVLREYQVRDRIAALHNPGDPYTADDAAEGKGE